MEQERRTAAVLDDEPLTRMDLRDMLTEQGFDVVGEAADGFDAVELCREKHPDVVLMDVKMPVFDGLTASETILTENLAKSNDRIHTDAIKENLIPPELSAKQISMVYASEADVLNMGLFGMTAKQWRDSHPDLKGNIRDYANVSQLVCLSNLENLNAVFINEGMSQAERLTKLNAIAISQMEILTQDHRIEALEAHSEDLSPME